MKKHGEFLNFFKIRKNTLQNCKIVVKCNIYFRHHCVVQALLCLIGIKEAL